MVTILAGGLSAWVLYKTIRFVFVTGRWDIIEVNLRLLMIGRFPDVHVLRLAMTAVALERGPASIAGIILLPGPVDPRVAVTQPADRGSRRDLVGRFWILAVFVLLLLSRRRRGAMDHRGLSVVAAIVGRVIGPFIEPLRMGSLGGALLFVVLAAVPVILYFYIVDAVKVEEWGGFMLNLFLAVCSIILCYPLGVLSRSDGAPGCR